MEQLGYIIGDSARNKTLLNYYNTWKFKHPNPTDFIRIAEKTSGIQLDWYKEYWIHSTKTIDYALDSLWEEGGVSKIRLKRLGQLPMPIDVELVFKDSSTENHSIPLNLMFGSKKNDNLFPKPIIEEEWRWTHTTYTLSINRRLTDLIKIEIDPSKRMADVQRNNNQLMLKW